MGDDVETRDGGALSLLPEPSNARADGLNGLTARFASFLAVQSGAPPAAGSRLPDRLAVHDRPARRWRQLALGGGLAAAGALLVAMLLGRPVADGPAAALTYTVDGAPPPRGGYVRSPVAHDPLLAFSDGTRIRMMPSARARVLALDGRGARVVLEAGRAHVEVAHRPNADWQIQAGAFLIHVHGTAFFVEWSPESARLEVRMESGVVSVDGPLPGDTVMLRAGQSLSRSLEARPAGSAAGPAPASEHMAAVPPPAPPAERPRGPMAPSTTNGALGSDWPEELARGRAARILVEAERQGVARVLAERSSEDLAALADAARYRQRDDLARRALLAQRKRFPGTTRAEEASFQLGRLEDRPAGRASAALGWYDRYLGDAPRGTYAAEALGRKMMVLLRQHRDVEARAIAADYLRRFPAGSYAHAARALEPPAR